MADTPEGWYPDPSKRHELRWHNGNAWTTAVRDAGVQGVDDPRQVAEVPDASLEAPPMAAVPTVPPLPGSPPAPPVDAPQGVIGASVVALVAAGGLLVGSVLPWATASTPFGTLSVAGTKGDGKITILIALAIGLVALLRLRRPIGAAPGVLVLIAAAIAVVVCAIDMGDVSSRVQEAEDTSDLVSADIGIGLWLCLASAIVAAAAGLAMIGQRKTTATADDDVDPADLGETM